MNKVSTKKGFTLIEILVVIGIIAILAAIVIIAINPARQFAQARNSQRTSNVNAILNAVGQRLADNKGLFRDPSDTVCTSAMDLPTSAKTIADSGVNTVNMYDCFIPTYIPAILTDPGNPAVFTTPATTPHFTTSSDYYTGYTIIKDATTQRIKVCAPGYAEPAVSSPAPAPLCVER